MSLSRAAQESVKTSCFSNGLSHNEGVSYRSKMLALLLVIPAGCSTAPKQPPPDITTMPEAELVATPPKPVVAVKPAPTPAPTPTPPVVTNRFIAPTETWVALERWCQANGFAAPRRTATEQGWVYSFAAANGTFVIRVGSQLASWRGVEYHLGFAPQMVNGHPFIHALDIRKNFEPLLGNSFHARTNRVIVIDPGHGGTDTGTKSVFNGHSEKEFTLDWARRLQLRLATNGWTVLLTRDSDVEMKLPARVAFAEQHKADLFVSLHFNSAFPDHEEAGLETYCLTPKGMPSTLTRGYKDDWSLAFPNNHFDTENVQYAGQVHRELLKVNGHADRGVRRARFLGVLQGQNRPAVLIEGGYLSNSTEARHIADPAYREKLAEAVALALREDFVGGGNPARPAPVAAPVTNRPAPPMIQPEEQTE